MPVWKQSRSLYARSGHELWNKGVIPFEVSSNPALARVYTHLIEAWLRDCKAKKPVVCVVELGCGTGRFGYYMLRALEMLDVRYVMTDISPKSLEQLHSHRRLRSFERAGRLSFAALALGDPLPIPREATHTVVIANYVFDSVPADVFSARTGVLCEWRDEDGAFTLEASRGKRYPDPLLQRILTRFTREQYPIFSVSALVTDFLRSLSSPTLVLASDKAFVRKDQPTRELSPFIQNHGGTASVTVDFEVLAAVAEGLGMRALMPRGVASFSTAVLSLGPKVLTATEASFAQAFTGGGVIEGLRIWARLSAASAGIDIQDAIALLRQSHGDPEIFARLAPNIGSLLRPEHRAPLLDALRLVSKNLYFTGDPTLDPSFALGELFLQLASPKDAERCFRDAAINGTQRKNALEFLISCYVTLGRDDEARETEQALAAARLEPGT